ncbi:MAG: hypothetical protein ACREPG_07840 [Candidatus Binatia bacterium]
MGSHFDRFGAERKRSANDIALNPTQFSDSVLDGIKYITGLAKFKRTTPDQSAAIAEVDKGCPEKGSGAIISALDNVMRISRNCDSRRPWHAACQYRQILSASLSPDLPIVKRKDSAEKLAFTLRQGSGRTGRGLITLGIFRSC